MILVVTNTIFGLLKKMLQQITNKPQYMGPTYQRLFYLFFVFFLPFSPSDIGSIAMPAVLFVPRTGSTAMANYTSSSPTTTRIDHGAYYLVSITIAGSTSARLPQPHRFRLSSSDEICGVVELAMEELARAHRGGARVGLLWRSCAARHGGGWRVCSIATTTTTAQQQKKCILYKKGEQLCKVHAK